MTRNTKQPIIMLVPPVVLGVGALAFSVALGSAVLAFALGTAAILCVAAAAWRVIAVYRTLVDSNTQTQGTLQAVATGDRRLPTFDRQTGLLAEWYFRLRFDEEITRAKRYGHALTALTLSPRRAENIDALREVTRRYLRQVDFAADLDGVIGVCLPDTGREGAQVVIDRINETSAEIDVHIGAYPIDGVTLSALLNEQAWRTRPVDDALSHDGDIAA